MVWYKEAEKDKKYKLEITIDDLDERHKDEFIEFFKCLRFTRAGCSRKFEMFVDGDGAFRCDVDIKDTDMKDCEEVFRNREKDDFKFCFD